jgi:halimadienyl-diphosphate synthase
MNHLGRIHQLLEEVGPGLRISRSAYDTAWVARLTELDEPLGEEALEWLRAHQLPDGSWGAEEPYYYHDRLVCTLATMIALAKHRRAEDRKRWRRGQLALEWIVKGLGMDPAGETVGFEMIVPTLIDEAAALGLIQENPDPALQRLTYYRAAKLAALKGHKINRDVTLAFSTEMVGANGLDLLNLANLQEVNGSVAYSPAATAFYALHMAPDDRAALEYLHTYAVEGALPYVVPIDVFEHAWPLWYLTLDGLPTGETLRLCQPHLDFLESAWIPGQGIASVAGLSFTDGDATSMTFDVLRRFDRPVDLDGVRYYEEADLFRCYRLEANPSISTNVHVLSALRQAGLDAGHPMVTKVLDFLQRTQTLQLFWFDKWHASPYYSTGHAIVASAGYTDDLVRNAVFWILETQNADGSWGYYLPTAEETAYCLQALVAWRRAGHQVAAGTIEKGAAWLADHVDQPYPPLWIGKCLYCPELVVRSAILCALALVDGE